MDIPDEQFYNKVAAKFGGYKSGAIYTQKFSDGDPEQIFLEALLGCAGNAKIAMDIGCADGRFTLKIAQNFKQIIAIDVSEKMLDAAKQLQVQQKISNVLFQKMDAAKTSFDGEYFDTVYSRRGPTPYQEIHRVLKKDGYFVEIRIGPKDAMELKEVFGRGQDFDHRNTSAPESKRVELEAVGLAPVFVKECFYSDYYPNINNLSLFLGGVPIFKDFDPIKDAGFLSAYAEKMNTQEGIELKRHRVVIVAHKI